MKSTTKFGRRKKPREMMIRNLACSVVLFENVVTTRSKGKTIKMFLEQLISKSKKQYEKNPLLAMRTLESMLPDKKAVYKVFEVLIPQFKERVGGYVSISPYLPRKSDNAERVKITLLQ
ncbi:MAG: hypothetical protein Fur0024_0480 [Patescibacteria group bacterium]